MSMDRKKKISEDNLIESIKDDILQGFELFAESVFPKKCKTCGRAYHNFQELIEMSVEVSGTKGNLKDYDATCFADFRDEVAEKMVVANYVDCQCGSTLIILGKDRRDGSNKGKRHRDTFNKVLDVFEKLGIQRKESRLFLRTLFRKILFEQVDKKQLEDELRNFTGF